MECIGAGPGIYPMNGGGGEGGTPNYNDLQNKPTLNGVTIEGDKTSEDYGIGSADAQKILEQSIENYYALRRTGKVYQTKLWKFAANPTSAGEKLLDNAGLVFEPSTDTEEGQDDYLNGQHSLFEWVHCNYIRDDDGTARPIALEGDSNYATIGAVDVGAMQMSFWYKWDSSNAEYDLITVSNLPHSELGLEPWPECVKADGTVLPWCIGSAYVSGLAEDGKLRSQPGLKPERNQSHNSMITNYQSKGAGTGELEHAETRSSTSSMRLRVERRTAKLFLRAALITIINMRRQYRAQRHIPTSRLQTRRQAICWLEAMCR